MGKGSSLTQPENELDRLNHEHNQHKDTGASFVGFVYPIDFFLSCLCHHSCSAPHYSRKTGPEFSRLKCWHGKRGPEQFERSRCPSNAGLSATQRQWAGQKGLC